MAATTHNPYSSVHESWMAYEPNEAAAQRVTENIMTAIARPVNLKGRETFISASIGISLFPDDGDTTDLLIKDANTAMYSAKATRKNNYLFYKAEMSVEAEQRFQVANELRLALEKAQFELHYQPLISLDSNAIVGVEALIRWRHPEHGLVKRIVSETGIPPELLVLEVTESVMMEAFGHELALLTDLREYGVSIAMDDFGTGYSSLAALKKLPIENLKIDRTYIQGLPEDDEDRSITTTIIQMAAALGLAVIAEGVETQAQLEFLKSLGCEEAQGYLISRPLPADQVDRWLVQLSTKDC